MTIGMQHFLAVAIAMIMLLPACSDKSEKSGEKDLQTLENAVLAMHDEVMPKMADISSLRNQLKNLIAADSSNTELLERVQKAVEQLDEADDAMLSWMHHYSDSLPDEPDARVEFLEEEEKNIREVRNKMLQSIDDARSILDNEKEQGK